MSCFKSGLPVFSSSLSRAGVAISKSSSHIVSDPVTNSPENSAENSTQPAYVSISLTVAPRAIYTAAVTAAPAAPPMPEAAIIPPLVLMRLSANTEAAQEAMFAAIITAAAVVNMPSFPPASTADSSPKSTPAASAVLWFTSSAISSTAITIGVTWGSSIFPSTCIHGISASCIHTMVISFAPSKVSLWYTAM